MAILACQAQLDLDEYTFQAMGLEQGGAGGAGVTTGDSSGGSGGSEPALGADNDGAALGGRMDQGAGGARTDDSEMTGSAASGGGGGTMNGSGGSSQEPSGPEPIPSRPPDGECMSEDQLLVLYRDRTNGDESPSAITMALGVENRGAPTFELTDLTLRYWFAGDGFSDFVSSVDYATQTGATALTSAVSVSFGEERGSRYAEIGFTAGDPVGPEGVQEILLRVATPMFDILQQANDFSFFAGASSSTPNRNITPYIAGQQAGGCVPLP